MELTQVVAAIVLVLLLASIFWLLARRFGKTRYRLTGPELRNQALRESERLAGLISDRDSHRPPDDPVIQDHQLAERHSTSYDEETLEIYKSEHMPKVAELRQHFAARRIRNGMLDELHDSAESEADLRTISTALQEMAGRIKES